MFGHFSLLVDVQVHQFGHDVPSVDPILVADHLSDVVGDMVVDFVPLVLRMHGVSLH